MGAKNSSPRSKYSADSQQHFTHQNAFRFSKRVSPSPSDASLPTELIIARMSSNRSSSSAPVSPTSRRPSQVSLPLTPPSRSRIGAWSFNNPGDHGASDNTPSWTSQSQGLTRRPVVVRSPTESDDGSVGHELSAMQAGDLIQGPRASVRLSLSTTIPIPEQESDDDESPSGGSLRTTWQPSIARRPTPFHLSIHLPRGNRAMGSRLNNSASLQDRLAVLQMQLRGLEELNAQSLARFEAISDPNAISLAGDVYEAAMLRVEIDQRNRDIVGMKAVLEMVEYELENRGLPFQRPLEESNFTEVADDPDLCQLCYSRKVNAKYACCNYQGACVDCATLMQQTIGRCPHCRAETPSVQYQGH